MEENVVGMHEGIEVDYLDEDLNYEELNTYLRLYYQFEIMNKLMYNTMCFWNIIIYFIMC